MRFAIAGEPQASGHDQFDQRLSQRPTGLHVARIILAHPLAAREAGEGSIYDPPIWPNSDTAHAGCTPNAFDIPVTHHYHPTVSIGEASSLLTGMAQ
ncbi:MAG TPA: hypothetical protein VFN11_06870 [Ktedonobacterales bacterium]|nr:hypothetical protein [Ktedonobacterales bacterium]